MWSNSLGDKIWSAAELADTEDLPEGMQDQVLANFIQNPLRNPNQLDQILERLAKYKDVRILFLVPTIYRSLLPHNTLLEMKTFADQNSDIIDVKATLDILNIALSNSV